MKSLSAAARAALLMLLPALGMTTGAVAGEKQYGPGVTDTEIKIGNIMPYSGPASSYGTIGKAEVAYFAMVNDRGGVNGRKINFISRDDGYSPPKTIEVARQLVEQEHVLLLFTPLGTPTNLAIRGYMNERKVPQLFIISGATALNDPKHFPWSTPGLASYVFEGSIYGRYISKNVPDAKVAVLYQNDDAGKDKLLGLREGLGEKADKQIIATQSYETTDPTIDSQILSLRGSGANVLFTAAIAKFHAQAIRKVYDIGWRPMQFVDIGALSLKAVIQPAGPEKAVGLISATTVKSVADAQWHDDAEYKEWLAWMRKYNPTADISDDLNANGYTLAHILVHILEACGDDLTRDNVMKQAASIHDYRPPLFLPGVAVSTSPDDYAPVKQMQTVKFDGSAWKPFGELISGGSGN
jgi:branched-chain amino acid transport system substrate-binding protein